MAAVILAAGASTRMGEPKQLLTYRGQSLLRRAVNAAIGSRCRPVVVVLGANAEPLKREIADMAASPVVNPGWEEGMGSSIRVGLAALDAFPAVDAAVITLCDQPCITASLIDRLIATYVAESPALVAAEFQADGHPVRGAPALFSRRLFPDLLALAADQGARQVIRRYASEAAFVQMPEAELDVDTQGDYKALEG